MKKKLLILLFSFFIFHFSLLNPSLSAANPTDTVRRLYQSKRDVSDWEVILLALNGLEVRTPLFATNYFRRIEREVAANQGTYRLATDYARIILSFKYHGRNPENIDGHNLIERLINFEGMERQGANAYIWSLKALYGQPAHITTPLIESLLAYQRTDGGFSLTLSVNARTDVDITAMAITALAPYTTSEAVNEAVNNGISFLAAAQRQDGTYVSIHGAVSSETLSQVIIALCAAGVNIHTDPRFIKNNRTLLHVLDTFRHANGQYAHTIPASGVITVNAVATRQALLALTAAHHAARYDADDPAVPHRGIFQR
jgi:hypothetical protein